jgi:selenide,water dikinase
MSDIARTSVRLTNLARGGGCACKLPENELSAILGVSVPSADPRVLVGNETLDDAACFLVSDDGTAIVQTVDFFTPIVDDPLTFGRIAATNAISDIYAMGGTPRFALALGGFPVELDRDVVAAVMRGGQATAASAGIAILGGHTILAAEPIYGLTVTAPCKRTAGGAMPVPAWAMCSC